MIYHVTTATANAGTMGPMGEWAEKVTDSIKERHGVEITVLRNVAGSGAEWHFLTTHDSLAALESYMDAVSSDPHFQTLVGEAYEQELWQATRTSIFRTV